MQLNGWRLVTFDSEYDFLLNKWQAGAWQMMTGLKYVNGSSYVITRAWMGWCNNTFVYGAVIMGAMASQITNLTIVYSSVYFRHRRRRRRRKHQSSASLAFVRGVHRWPVNSPHKESITRKMFPFDDVIMIWVFTDNFITVHILTIATEPQMLKPPTFCNDYFLCSFLGWVICYVKELVLFKFKDESVRS